MFLTCENRSWELDLNLGTKLRAVREQHGLTQRQLAKRAGITNASISLIESGRTNPLVGNLKRLLDGIPMSLAEFFAMEHPEEEAKNKVFFPAGELTEIGRDKISFQQVGFDLTKMAIQILHERYAPGADTGKILLRHEAEEGGIVISGKIEVTVGRQKRVLKAGDAYYFNSRIPHRFRNAGPEDCMIVSACTPPSV